MLILDNAVVIDWLLAEGPIERIEVVLRENAGDLLTAWLFWAELPYVLGKRVARGQIELSFRDASLQRVQGLGVVTDAAAAAPGPAFERMMALSDRYALTVYDAVYLELAIRRSGRLATTDRKLAAAARTAGVDVAP
jgi:predicted nucleic acid-binding protein